jgi:sugar (pentulose or hexulose) kinase
MNYWMGGLSSSGGSVEWLRSALGDPELSYTDITNLLEKSDPTPTGILYFPYLAGSGSPHSDLRVRAAFVGLDAAHTCRPGSGVEHPAGSSYPAVKM